jgi:hypothetical protein
MYIFFCGKTDKRLSPGLVQIQIQNRSFRMFVMIYFSGDYFLFDSVFIKKKITKLKILKKNETGSNRLISVRFSF